MKYHYPPIKPPPWVEGERANQVFAAEAVDPHVWQAIAGTLVGLRRLEEVEAELLRNQFTRGEVHAAVKVLLEGRGYRSLTDREVWVMHWLRLELIRLAAPKYSEP